MTRPRQPDPSPSPGTRPPEYVIELWVSPQLTEGISRAAPRTGERQRTPQSEARPEDPVVERVLGPLDRPVQPRARQAEPELEAG